jgi:hypothetical protein
VAVLQALFALISRSAGKILNAVFGWAVRALFGHASETERTLLSGLVAAAAAWPFLLVGLVAPKIATLLLAFVPLPDWVPGWTVRLVWAALVLIVPCAVGIAVAMRGPPQVRRRPFWRRLVSGFPITLGLALAFIIMFVTVPVLRLVSLLKGEQSGDVPLVTEAEAYRETAALCIRTLNAHGFGMAPTNPGWWAQAPLRVLRVFSHDAFAAFVPEHLESYAGPGLRVSFFPSGAVLRGKSGKLSWAHGLIAETTAEIDGFQTSSATAQRLEAQIHRLWKILNEEPVAHLRSHRLLGLTRELVERLGETNVAYDDWQVLYRQLMQLERALRGEPQLLESQRSAKDNVQWTNERQL